MHEFVINDGVINRVADILKPHIFAFSGELDGGFGANHQAAFALVVGFMVSTAFRDTSDPNSDDIASLVRADRGYILVRPS